MQEKESILHVGIENLVEIEHSVNRDNRSASLVKLHDAERLTS